MSNSKQGAAEFGAAERQADVEVAQRVTADSEGATRGPDYVGTQETNRLAALKTVPRMIFLHGEITLQSVPEGLLLLLDQLDEAAKSGGTSKGDAPGSQTAIRPDESDDDLSTNDLKEVMREALKLIDSNGLDSPEGHLERAAVA